MGRRLCPGQHTSQEQPGLWKSFWIRHFSSGLGEGRTGDEVSLSFSKSTGKDSGAENKTSLHDRGRNNFTFDRAIVVMIWHRFEPLSNLKEL